MRTEIASNTSQLSRRALARSWTSGRPVEAWRIDGQEPTYFAAGELLVDATDDGLIDDLVRRGGRVVRRVHGSLIPEEFRRLGLGREREVDPTGLPSTVKIRFDEVPTPRGVDADTVLSRALPNVERVEWSSETAQSLAVLVAPMRLEGRRVSLNAVGEPDSLPLVQPQEGTSTFYGLNPLTWACMNGRSRIADAWHLVETMRLMESVSAVQFIAICDNGFWWDPSAPAGSPAAQTRADIGSGLVRWNAVEDERGIPPGAGANWHGTRVASAAAAVTGNSTGAAGSGGTVAVPCFFHSDYSTDSALNTMIRCTQWSIPIVNFSWGVILPGLFYAFFDHDGWVDTFHWAANNGVLAICSAGNQDFNLPDDAIRFPTTRTPRTLTVGALSEGPLGEYDTKASSSSFGNAVHLWAPGTTIPVVPTPMTSTGTAANGTSFAAPLVSGVAAMMRAVNPTLTADNLRDKLLESAWEGTGKVKRGLDAYAAVWEAMRPQMAEDALQPDLEQLYTAADGTFEPVFNHGFNYAGDEDTFLLEITTYADLRVELEWYDRLATLVTLELDSVDGDQTVEVHVARPQSRRAVLTAAVAPGKYHLRLRGSGPTAYLLNGRITPGRLHPDRFEPNDSFNTATRLRILPRERWDIRGLLHGPWGPGSFDLNLHTAGDGPDTTDRDFFVIDVPANVGTLRRPELWITRSDQPVDVTLYDATRAVVANHRGKKHITLTLPLGETVYVKISGKQHTRYGLWVGAYLDDELFCRLWPEVQLVPNWWEEQRIGRFLRPQEDRAVLVTPELIEDNAITFGGLEGEVLPDGVRVGLLDANGEVVHEGIQIDGRTVVSLQGVREGPYVLRARLEGEALEAAQSSGLGFAVEPPVFRPNA